jgi:hypothetical protein
MRKGCRKLHTGMPVGNPKMATLWGGAPKLKVNLDEGEVRPVQRVPLLSAERCDVGCHGLGN